MAHLGIKKGIISIVMFSFILGVNAQQTKKSTSTSSKITTPTPTIKVEEKYAIKIKVNGLRDTVCYLANYYGDKQYLRDTAKVDEKGNFTFEGNSKLDGGIYLIVLPGNNYFETIITDEQNFSMETDTADFVRNMTITNSSENTVFYDYLKYVNTKDKQVQDLRKNSKTDSINVTNQLIAIDKEVSEYRKTFMETHTGSFVTKVFKASNEIEIPENPNPLDSNYAYFYYRNHYFDNIDWTDDNILRTPIFHPKLDEFINKVIPHSPDSMIVEVDKLLNKAATNKELFKYCVWYITNNSEQSKIMGIDALTIHLYKKYYLSGKAYWVDNKTTDKIKEQVDIKERLLIGKIMPNVYFKDSLDVYKNLWDVNANYIVVFFYSPNCGHCQKDAPKLYEFFMKNKSQVMVYAANIDKDEPEWKKFIVKNKFTDWLNVWDKGSHHDHRKEFDVTSTPMIYLLDKSKKIIAKRIGVEHLQDFIDYEMKMKEK
jgi:thiol-disulfide isomerase/thioredoxin